MAKVVIADQLQARAQKAAQAGGYSSLEEFIAHCIEKELQRVETEAAEADVKDQLRGLGYLE